MSGWRRGPICGSAARCRGVPRRQRNSAGAFDVNGAIGLCGRLGENADEINDGIGSGDSTANTCDVQYIGLNNLRCFGRSSRYLHVTGMPDSHTHRRANLK